MHVITRSNNAVMHIAQQNTVMIATHHHHSSALFPILAVMAGPALGLDSWMLTFTEAGLVVVFEITEIDGTVDLK